MIEMVTLVHVSSRDSHPHHHSVGERWIGSPLETRCTRAHKNVDAAQSVSGTKQRPRLARASQPSTNNPQLPEFTGAPWGGGGVVVACDGHCAMRCAAFHSASSAGLSRYRL